MVANTVFSAMAEARLVSLAMHQETGRNIYIGALHYDELVPRPDNMVAAPGPKAMEYRVVARRTSIRSLMGNILLQGELATGKPPGLNTVEFAGDIMAAVRGSLYAGDSLEIRTDKDNRTVAFLGRLELARTNNREVSDYFLMSWVGKGGPSTAFRNSILSTDIDGSLMSIYSAHAASDKRIAAINAWAEPLEAEPPVEVSTTAAAPAIATVALGTGTAPTVASVTPEQLAASTADPLPPQTPVLENTEFRPESTEQITAAEPVLLASLTPTREMISPEPEEKSSTGAAIEAIDAMEYSQRLAIFNTLVLRNVYSQIRYPRAAVRRNIQGTLELDLVVGKEGNLLDISVARSSGHGMLDKSAVKAAQAAFSDTPLRDIDPVAIAEYSEEGSQLVIPIPISFILTD